MNTITYFAYKLNGLTRPSHSRGVRGSISESHEWGINCSDAEGTCHLRTLNSGLTLRLKISGGCQIMLGLALDANKVVIKLICRQFKCSYHSPLFINAHIGAYSSMQMLALASILRTLTVLFN
jgi:hypothetical protein